MTLDFKFMKDTFFMSLHGIPVTLELTVVSLLFSIPVGFLMAVANRNKVPVLSHISKVFISFMRGTPMILQIFLIYNSLPSFLSAIFKVFHMNIAIYNINNIFYALVVFSLSETAALAEVFRSALGTVSKGQMEAAHSVGLTTFQSYVRIIIPQALVSAIPVLCNSTTDLIKATSLAFSMAVMDMTAIAKIQAAMQLSYIEAYLDIFFLYLILILVVEQLFKLAERKLKVYKIA
jgi:L-cystine transport system permease protein